MAKRTPQTKQLEGNENAPSKVKTTRLYVALETVTKSKNGGVTPTLKRLAACAMRKLIARQAKKG